MSHPEAVPIPSRFGLLGPLTMRDAAGRPVELRALKTRLLLAVLLLEANRPLSRDRLSAALWGEHPPTTATASLNNQVAGLRRRLGQDGATRLRTVPGGYLLRVQTGELDAEVFSERLRLAGSAQEAADWPAVSEHTAAALALWRGEPLADLPTIQDAALPHVQRLREARLQGLDLHFEAELRLGRLRSLLPELARQADEHPLRESFHRRLMLALHEAGRQAEALAVYRSLRRRLVDELGIEPGSEVQEAHRTVLTPVGPAERSWPGESASQPPPHQLPPYQLIPQHLIPEQLPADVPDFTGRERQLADLAELLTGSGAGSGAGYGPGSGIGSGLGSGEGDGGAVGARAVVVGVVSGTGGIGKTTLAVHLAHRVAPDFPDGRLYVNLGGGGGPVAAPSDVLAGFLRDLGDAESAVPAKEEERAARFRTLTAGRRLLVVLDNAVDSAQVRPLLPGTGRSAVLVTSRNRLAGLTGAIRSDLDVLDAEQSLALFAAVVGAGRVEAEPEAAAEVVRCCAGLPLALRISGARLAARPGWTVATLAARLADERRRLDELLVEDVAVRASFRMSYDSLARPLTPGRPPLARVFRLLGLIQGDDVSLPAVAALFGRSPEQAEDLLEQLVDACILDSPTHGCYRLHDLLRVYAAELAEQDEPEELRREAVRRVALWYLGTVRAADRILVPGARRGEIPDPDPLHPPAEFADYDAALRWFHKECDNIVAVTRAAAAHGVHDLAWQLAAVAWGYFRQCARHQEWQRSNEIGLACARELGDLAAEARLLNSQAGLAIQTRRLEEAEGLYLRMAAISRKVGDPVGELTALGNRALVVRRLGWIDLSRQLSLTAIERAKVLGRRVSEAFAHSNLGICADLQGDYEASLAHHRESLSIWTELVDHDGRAVALTNIGAAHLNHRRYESALEALREALPTAEAVGNRLARAEALGNLGRTLIALERPEEARGHLEAAHDCWSGADEAEAEKVRALLEELDAAGR